MNKQMSHKLPPYMYIPGIPTIKNRAKRKILILSERQQAMLDSVMKYFETNISDLAKKKRHKDLVYHRSICSYIMYVHGELTLKDIGALYAQHYSTIISQIHSVTDQLTLKQENSYKVDVSALENVIYGKKSIVA